MYEQLVETIGNKFTIFSQSHDLSSDNSNNNNSDNNTKQIHLQALYVISYASKDNEWCEIFSLQDLQKAISNCDNSELILFISLKNQLQTNSNSNMFYERNQNDTLNNENSNDNNNILPPQPPQHQQNYIQPWKNKQINTNINRNEYIISEDQKQMLSHNQNINHRSHQTSPNIQVLYLGLSVRCVL